MAKNKISVTVPVKFLPKEAVEILITAYSQAVLLPEGSKGRAELIDWAVKQVKQRWPQYFRRD